jgi:hypothetical protein
VVSSCARAEAVVSSPLSCICEGNPERVQCQVAPGGIKQEQAGPGNVDALAKMFHRAAS